MFIPRGRFVPTGLTGNDRLEIRMGREAWTWTDYVAAGRTEFDRIANCPNPETSAEREPYARAYAELFCPARKRRPASQEQSQ